MTPVSVLPSEADQFSAAEQHLQQGWGMGSEITRYNDPIPPIIYLGPSTCPTDRKTAASRKNCFEGERRRNQHTKRQSLTDQSAIAGTGTLTNQQQLQLWKGTERGKMGKARERGGEKPGQAFFFFHSSCSVSPILPPHPTLPYHPHNPVPLSSLLPSLTRPRSTLHS